MTDIGNWFQMNKNQNIDASYRPSYHTDASSLPTYIFLLNIAQLVMSLNCNGLQDKLHIGTVQHSLVRRLIN